MTSKRFRLSEGYLAKYKDTPPAFGYNGLGEVVFLDKYSRQKEDGTKEAWWECVKRVIEGTYNMQMQHIEEYGLGWNAYQAQKSAQEMYSRIFSMKFLPAGRGLFAMGSALTEEKRLFATLSNCCFVSSKNIKEEHSLPFVFAMDLLMLGVGVGYDVTGANTLIIKGVDATRTTETYVIPDTREGWVKSTQLLIDSFLLGSHPIVFDYSQLRAKGVPLKAFGGVASGPDPLIELHTSLQNLLEQNTGVPMSIRLIADVFNLIARCVVSGNVRRSAQVALGPEDEEFLNLKDPLLAKNREGWSWASNNSVLATVGQNYKEIARRVTKNGEPGIVWLENARQYSRMNGIPDGKDIHITGVNPCGEIFLPSYGACNLVEVFPARHDSLEDFLKTLKYAYLYAKTVSLGNTHWPEANRVLLRERRIGCSIGGVAQFLAVHDLNTLKQWLHAGYETLQKYDQIYSDWLAVPRSIKLSTVKPSGTVSLLNGSTAGIHHPWSRYSIRRMTFSRINPLVQRLADAGYPVVDKDKSPEDVLVEFPIDSGEGVRSAKELTLWEQFNLAAYMQEHWADNAVSVSITFQKSEESQIEAALNYFQYKLKGVSLMPYDTGAYAQPVLEEITEAEYHKRVAAISRPDFSNLQFDATAEKFCSNDSCTL